ncbi:MAG: hypothetical protein Q9161_001081 [Pseudevernia consocians]
MDSISLTVGTSGLVVLAAQTLKLTQQYLHGVKHASKAANTLAAELQLLHDTLCRLNEFLRSDGAKSQSFDEDSVLVSIIDRLRYEYVGQKAAIGFVHFDYQDQRSQSPENVIARLLRQVASQHPVLPPSLLELYVKFGKQNPRPQVEDLELTLLDVCQNVDQIFIAIDALDECDERTSRKRFLRFLATLQQNPSIRLFVTSRPYPKDIQKAFDSAPQITVEASDADLRKYLRRRIEDSSSADIVDEGFKQHLVETIAKGAQKMFLLPALQVQSIVSEPTAGDMEDALETMPYDLHQAFNQTLARIQRQPDGRRRLGMNNLLWISHAQGPLTVAELSEAMAVKSGNTSLDPRHLPLQNVMVECCMGLVTVDQESSSMRLVHFALQEFFRDQREEFFPREKTKLRRVALTTYLFLNDFVLGCCEDEAAIERLMKDFPLLRYASTNWGRHVQFSHCNRIYGLPLKLLYSPPCRALSLQIQHFSQRYRAESWEPDKVNSHNAFHSACNFGLQTAVCNILDSGDIDIDGATNIGTTALNWAASAGHVVLVKLLMSRGVDPMKANWYGTALHWAAEAG